MFFQVRKYLIPDSNDEIRQEQMREMELLTTAQAPNLSPNTSKNPLSVTNSDGQDDIGSDETGSNSSAQVKFIYSEKATKFCEISILNLTRVHAVKSKVEISQNFVAFSEYMNFKEK